MKFPYSKLKFIDDYLRSYISEKESNHSQYLNCKDTNLEAYLHKKDDNIGKSTLSISTYIYFIKCFTHIKFHVN